MTILKTYWLRFLRLSPLLMLVFLLLWLRSCREAAEQANRYSSNLQASDNTLRRYKLANGQLAFEKELLSVSHEELKEQVWVKDDSIDLLLKKIKDPVTLVKWHTRYVYDTIYIPFDTPLPPAFQKRFSKTGQWFSLSGSVNQERISIEHISIPNTQRLVVGYKKGKPIVSVTNSNPHLITGSIEGQVISIPKRHWVFGLGGTWNIYDPPAAGFFLGYKLFEF